MSLGKVTINCASCGDWPPFCTCGKLKNTATMTPEEKSAILQRVKDEVLGKRHTDFVDWRTGVVKQEDIDKIALRFHDAMIELSNK